MQFDIITLFPEMFSALTDSGITRRAFEEKNVPSLCGILAILRRTDIEPWMTGLMAVVRVWS